MTTPTTTTATTIGESVTTFEEGDGDDDDISYELGDYDDDEEEEEEGGKADHKGETKEDVVERHHHHHHGEDNEEDEEELLGSSMESLGAQDSQRNSNLARNHNSHSRLNRTNTTTSSGPGSVTASATAMAAPAAPASPHSQSTGPTEVLSKTKVVLSPASRRKKLLEMDELVSDEEEEEEEEQPPHDTIDRTKVVTKNIDDMEDEDDSMMMEDIDSDKDSSSVSEGGEEEVEELDQGKTNGKDTTNDEDDDDFSDDITDESDDDSDNSDGGGAYPGMPDVWPDVITAIRKNWKRSWFFETHKRRLEQIPEGDDEAETNHQHGMEGDETLPLPELNQAWSSLENHQRSWRTQRTVFQNNPNEDGELRSNDEDIDDDAEAESDLAKDDILLDSSPRAQIQRLMKLVTHTAITAALTIKNLDTIPIGVTTDVGRYDGKINDDTASDVVPVDKKLEKQVQSKEAEEEYELIDSFRLMKRTALLKIKNNDVKEKKKKTKKKKKEKRSESKSRSSKSTKDANAGDTVSSGKVKTRKSKKSPSTATPGASVADEDPTTTTTSKAKLESKSGGAPSLTDRSSTATGDEDEQLIFQAGKRRSKAVKTVALELPLKDEDASSKPPITPATALKEEEASLMVKEVPLKEDDASGRSKSKSRRKLKVEPVDATTDVSISTPRPSKHRRKVKGNTTSLDNNSDHDAVVGNDKSRTPSRSRRKLKEAIPVPSINVENTPSKSRRKLRTSSASGDMKDEDDLVTRSNSKSRRKLRVDTNFATDGDAKDQNDGSMLGNSSKSKEKPQPIEWDDSVRKTPSRSKRRSRSKGWPSSRELETLKFADVPPTARTPRAKAKRGEHGASLGSDEAEEDFHSTHSSRSASRQEVAVKSPSSEAGSNHSQSASTSRRRISNQDIPSDKRSSSSSSQKDRRPISPRQRRKSSVDEPLSLEDIGLPWLLSEDNGSRNGRKRGSRRRLIPGPHDDIVATPVLEHSSRSNHSHSSSRERMSMNNIHEKPKSMNNIYDHASKPPKGTSSRTLHLHSVPEREATTMKTSRRSNENEDFVQQQLAEPLSLPCATLIPYRDAAEDNHHTPLSTSEPFETAALGRPDTPRNMFGFLRTLRISGTPRANSKSSPLAVAQRTGMQSVRKADDDATRSNAIAVDSDHSFPFNFDENPGISTETIGVVEQASIHRSNSFSGEGTATFTPKRDHMSKASSVRSIVEKSRKSEPRIPRKPKS